MSGFVPGESSRPRVRRHMTFPVNLDFRNSPDNWRVTITSQTIRSRTIRTPGQPGYLSPSTPVFLNMVFVTSCASRLPYLETPLRPFAQLRASFLQSVPSQSGQPCLQRCDSAHHPRMMASLTQLFSVRIFVTFCSVSIPGCEHHPGHLTSTIE